jgi:heme-degrading monooxygenase HmoA
MEPWIVKHTLEKEDSDPLLEFIIGPHDLFPDWGSIPGFVQATYRRCQDRSYAEIYMIWESEQAWLDWYNDPVNSNFHDNGLRAIEEYCQTLGIAFERIFPPYANTGDTYNNMPMADVEFGDIFT